MKKLLILPAFLCLTQFISAQENPPPPPPPVQVFEEADSTATEDGKIDEDGIAEFPDREAKFKGGAKGLQSYIAHNIAYPVPAIEHNIEGKVYISFIVEKNGSISNVEIMKSAHPLLDKEAIRVVKKMPKWKPGKVGKKKVRTKCYLPIVFAIE